MVQFLDITDHIMCLLNEDGFCHFESEVTGSLNTFVH